MSMLHRCKFFTVTYFSIKLSIQKLINSVCISIAWNQLNLTAPVALCIDMKKLNLSIKIVLINTLILMSTNAQDLNRIGVIHQNLPTFDDANVRAFSASAFHESIAKEIATIDTVDQFEIVTYEQISAAIRTQSRDISCDNFFALYGHDGH